MPFRTRLKVRFGDIDHAGIVYYPRFLHYFHVAMEEFFAAELGLDYARFLDQQRLGLPTVHLETDFRRPLRYGDEIDVEVAIERLGESSIHWLYRVYRGEEPDPVAESRQVTVNLDLDTFRKQELPGWLRESLERHRVSQEPA